jgi:hypothetical protein
MVCWPEPSLKTARTLDIHSASCLLQGATRLSGYGRVPDSVRSHPVVLHCFPCGHAKLKVAAVQVRLWSQSGLQRIALPLRVLREVGSRTKLMVALRDRVY